MLYAARVNATLSVTYFINYQGSVLVSSQICFNGLVFTFPNWIIPTGGGSEVEKGGGQKGTHNRPRNANFLFFQV